MHYYKVTNSILEYFSWEAVDPLLLLFCSYFHPGTLLAFQLTILASGCYLYARNQNSTCKNALLVALSLSLSLATIAGWQTYLLKFHWFPFLLLLSQNLFEETKATKKVLHVVFFLSVAALWILTSGALAIWGLTLALINSAFNLKTHFQTFPSILFGLVVLAAFWWLNLPVAPDYSPGTRLSSNPVVNLKPLIGPWLRADYLNWPSLRMACYLFFAQGLLFWAIILLATRKSLKFFSYLALGLLPLGLCLVGILSLRQTASLGGLNGLYTLIPGLSLERLPQLSLGLLLILSFLGSLSTLDTKPLKRVLVLNSLVASLTLAYSLSSELSFLPKVESGKLERLRELSQVLKAKEYSLVSRLESISRDRFLHLSKKDLGSSKLRAATDFSGLKQAELKNPIIEATANNLLAPLAIDKNKITRWSSRKKQEEGDALYLSFSEPVKLSRLQISNIASRGQFPRHFKIVSDGKVLSEHSPWAGASMLTPNGLPYFGSKNFVVIDLPEPTSVSSLDIVITSPDHHTWSVHEIRLFERIEP